MNILKLTHNRAATLIEQVLMSAVASANEQEADMNSLIVQEVKIDEGPTMKRFRPKDRGRAHGIFKRTSHISVAVDEKG
jgi:large subunit ribosomal protein L22